MFGPQQRVDLEDDGSSTPTPTPTTGTATNVHRVLFNDLVEIVPLVQSLIDRKANTSFTRRGSMIYTKTPSRELLSKKINESKGKNATQSIPIKKRRDLGDKDQGKNAAGNVQDASADSFSIFSSRALPTEKEIEELIALREQVEDLQRKLSEKDELLKSAEISKDQITSLHLQLDELNHQSSEKDSLLKSTQLQLSDAKIKLADKQAALEKLQWEAMTSNSKVVKLQEDLDTTQKEMSSFMLLFEGLAKNSSTQSAQDYDVTSYHSDHLPDIDDLDEMEMQKIEEAREAYIAAVAAAKEKQDEDTIVRAASARSYLQSFVLRTKSTNVRNDSLYAVIPRAASETLAH